MQELNDSQHQRCSRRRLRNPEAEQALGKTRLELSEPLLELRIKSREVELVQLPEVRPVSCIDHIEPIYEHRRGHKRRGWLPRLVAFSHRVTPNRLSRHGDRLELQVQGCAQFFCKRSRCVDVVDHYFDVGGSRAAQELHDPAVSPNALHLRRSLSQPQSYSPRVWTTF